MALARRGPLVRDSRHDRDLATVVRVDKVDLAILWVPPRRRTVKWVAEGGIRCVENPLDISVANVVREYGNQQSIQAHAAIEDERLFGEIWSAVKECVGDAGGDTERNQAYRLSNPTIFSA